MAPLPLEGHQTPMGLPGIGQTPGGQTISLGMLIDFIVQRTYHELTILAELLPRKTDMERKIEIVQFAARTRQLFVRLLALVKWASSASKVDKSSVIMNFLDKQSMIFIDTADYLARMARQTLGQARLPNFHLPAAVEVLTTGSYMRLPTCIRDRIIPPDPITTEEKQLTLQRLNQIVQHRLVTTELPPQMRQLKIENGRVVITVEHEFKVSLTLMGDGLSVPWRLLDIEILVEDNETGGGKDLVHPLQIQYLIQVIQTRLLEAVKPIQELYSSLHSFCQSLQLEILQSQINRLHGERLGDFIKIEEYAPGKCLTVSYWRELASKDPRGELGYKLTVHVDWCDSAQPLVVSHVPSLTAKESELAEKAIRSDHLSIERLLVHTVYVRAKQRLTELKQEFENRLGGDVECSIQGSPAVLNIPILNPCLRSEQLLISVDTHSGFLLAHVPLYETPLTNEIQNSLNSDKGNLGLLISELRYWITKRRIEKTLQHLSASGHERMPLLHHPNHQINKLSKHKMFITFHRHPSYLLVVELKESPSSPCEVQQYFHLISIKPCSIEDDPKDDSVETELPKTYMRVLNMMEFDSFVATHGPFTKIDVQDQYERVLGKRKSTGRSDPPTKRTKHPAYFLPDVAHVVALCDDRIPFAVLASELEKRGIYHQGIEIEAKGTSLCVRLLNPPIIEGISESTREILSKSLLSATFRIQCKGSRMLALELVFTQCPVSSQNPKEQTSRRPIHFHYNLTSSENMTGIVDNFLTDWAQISNLYQSVLQLADFLEYDKGNVTDIMVIKSYNYKQLMIGYGPQFGMTVTVSWKSEKQFSLQFGTNGTLSTLAANPHSMLALQLEVFFNQHYNLIYLVRVLHETFTPLLSLSKLPLVPQLGAILLRPNLPVQTFLVLPQSPFHVRLAYCNSYCLDIHMRGEGLVAIRDGAYSLCDKSKVVDEFTPTQGLKAFLSKYVDESAVLKRRSQSEDDNPPSPMATDHLDSPHFLSQTLKPSSPSSREGLRFPTPLTPTSYSNPHTPASPHTGGLQSGQHQGYSSSPATSFPLASPPSLPSNVNPSPSPSNPLHVPSPSFLPSPSPGGQVGMSPASSFMNAQQDGSPFPTQSLASPAAQQWPGSPSLPRPSPLRPGHSPGHPALHSPQNEKAFIPHMMRVLPQRSWAGAIPTLLTHEAFDVLCTSVSEGAATNPQAPLHRFLCSVYLKRHVQRVIQQDKEAFTPVPTSEPWVIMFKVETLQCRVCVDTTRFQSLHLKLQPAPEHQESYNEEDIQVLEQFFSKKVILPPARPSALQAFMSILTAPALILKDCVQIMKLELYHQPQAKWTVQWCLTIPPNAPPIAPVGTAAVIVKNKMLFFLQFTRQLAPSQLPPNCEPPSVILPIMFASSSNSTQMVDRQNFINAAIANQVHAAFKRVMDFNLRQGEYSLFPCIRELLTSLEVPCEVQSPVSVPGPGPMVVGRQSPMAGGAPQYAAGGVPPQPGAPNPASNAPAMGYNYNMGGHIQNIGPGQPMQVGMNMMGGPMGSQQ